METETDDYDESRRDEDEDDGDNGIVVKQCRTRPGRDDNRDTQC